MRKIIPNYAWPLIMGHRNSTNILVLCVNVKNVIPQKSENVRSHSNNSIENATPL